MHNAMQHNLSHRSLDVLSKYRSALGRWAIMRSRPLRLRVRNIRIDGPRTHAPQTHITRLGGIIVERIAVAANS